MIHNDNSTVILNSDFECDSLHSEGDTTYSPAPWSYIYSPYTVTSVASPLGIGADIPAYEVFDNDGNKIFDTNEDLSDELQRANARLGAAAPRLLASLIVCANLMADYDESEGEEGEAHREAVAAIEDAIGGAV